MQYRHDRIGGSFVQSVPHGIQSFLSCRNPIFITVALASKPTGIVTVTVSTVDSAGMPLTENVFLQKVCRS